MLRTLNNNNMIWKRLKNDPTMMVSENGDVRKYTDSGNFFQYKPTLTPDGYYRVKTYGCHQWVAMAFLDHEPNGNEYVVDHIDGNRKNNHVSNLQIITQGENILKRNTPKTSIYPFVAFEPKSQRYRVALKAEGKVRYYGSFSNEDDAGKVSKTLCEIYRPHYLKYFENL